MQFVYQARDVGGRIRDGVLSAANADEAATQLRTEGLYLLSLETGEEGGQSKGLALFRKRVSRGEIIYLTTQLAVMIDAGVPLASALSGLAAQSENPTLKETLQAVQRDVEAGENFSAALARFPKLFDRTFVNLVRASESSGTLAPMLERIAAQSRAELETRQKVRGALMYPGVMLVLCIGVCIFLLTYVFPKLMPMFTIRKLEVPGPTRFMMALSTLLTHDWYWVLAGLVALVVGLISIGRQQWGRAAFDRAWLKLPLFGPMIRKVAISRSLRTLSSTVNAGVPVLEAIELSSGVAGNVHYERVWLDAAEKVAGGQQIHEALAGNPLFPATLLQMISSGESTGKLGMVLDKVSDFFDREVENAVKTATTLVEPIMVCVMGSVIGTIALAMLLPIFKLSTAH